jgi:hypothetical protein
LALPIYYFAWCLAQTLVVFELYLGVNNFIN